MHCYHTFDKVFGLFTLVATDGRSTTWVAMMSVHEFEVFRELAADEIERDASAWLDLGDLSDMVTRATGRDPSPSVHG